MKVQFLSLAAWFSLACLALTACAEKQSPDTSGGGNVRAGTTTVGKIEPAASAGGLSADSLPAEEGGELEEPEKSIAEALAGRWEARFAASSAVIELETVNGGLSGSVSEPGKPPVRIEIGIVTADGFLFETRGDARYIWIARLTGDVLSGRREKVDNGSVEKFDGYRAPNVPPL
jgi:hypothetical protein